MVTPRVRLVRLLGKGGMGSVWVADHLTLNTQVAVKFILASVASGDPAMLARFEREARVAAQIKSPHVVQTYDHGVMDDGTPFIVMELLEGESLADRLKRAGPLSLEQADLLVRQTTKVLSKAHELGVVHRDIKPDNLFCIESGYDLFIKVLDFGIAKQPEMPSEHGMTRTGAMLGTPYYMSPEQVTSAKHAGPRADLWALTVATYEALTGAVPFQGETLGALCIAIVSAQFTPASVATANLPLAMDFWFARALHVDPDQRFQTANEFAEAFSAAVKAIPVAQAGAPIQQATVAGAPAVAPGPAQLATGAAPPAGAVAGPTWGTQAPPGQSGYGAPAQTATGPSGATFTGAASTLNPAEPQKSRMGLIVGVGLLLAVLAGGGILVGRLTSSTAESDAEAAAPNDSGAAASEAPAASAVPSQAPAAAEPTATASASATVSASAASSQPATPPTKPVSPPKALPRTQKPNCVGDNALETINGIQRVRPECR
ncbi:MAG: serine/threonine protein kinase [Deltaproteobacteria bacterium]|nr:MAG: serine/threonine protein kinase [Deltaproteobacteria bacterium]